MKKYKLDEKTQKALDTICNGDKVIFYDCFEALVYKNDTFHVTSEHPRIEHSKYGTHVLVLLSNLGWFPIGKLKRIDDDFIFSDTEMKKALHCCGDDVEFPDCENCPYNVLPKATCSIQMIKDNNDRVRRHEEYLKSKGGAI